MQEIIDRIEEMRVENEKTIWRLAEMAAMAVRALDVVLPMLRKIQPRLNSYDRMLNEERRHLAQQAGAALKQADRIIAGKEDADAEAT